MIPVPSLNNQPVLSTSDIQLFAGYLNRVQRKEERGRVGRHDLNEPSIPLT